MYIFTTPFTEEPLIKLHTPPSYWLFAYTPGKSTTEVFTARFRNFFNYFVDKGSQLFPSKLRPYMLEINTHIYVHNVYISRSEHCTVPTNNFNDEYIGDLYFWFGFYDSTRIRTFLCKVQQSG